MVNFDDMTLSENASGPKHFFKNAFVGIGKDFEIPATWLVNVPGVEEDSGMTGRVAAIVTVGFFMVHKW